MSNYLDVEKKFFYYKEKLINEFTKKGIYPDNKLINKRLSSIDMNLSLFKNYNVKPGQYFDTDNYNESLKLIFNDIKILYEILEKISVDEYNNLQISINSYINELSSLAKTYEKKAQYENNSTSLGETILFQDNNFTITQEDSTSIITLNDITVEEGSEIACIANINNISLDNVIFEFSKETISASPYNGTHDTLTVPGNKIRKEYDYSIENSNGSSNIIMNIEADPDNKNTYDILSGLNKISVTSEDNNCYLQELPNNSGVILFKEKSSINFYVLNGTYITFKFNKKPLSCNFSLEDTSITNLNYIHNFHIEVSEDTTLEIESNNGMIYAIREDGIINNKKLYYTGRNLSSDYHIIETVHGNEITMDAKVKILNCNDEIDIDSIVIKKLD